MKKFYFLLFTSILFLTVTKQVFSEEKNIFPKKKPILVPEIKEKKLSKNILLPIKKPIKKDKKKTKKEETVKEIMSRIKNENLDYVLSYQSRVGPLKWIGPSTDEVIIKYSKEKKGIVIVPVAFVSEHSETLVELDIEYKKLAKKNGCSFYKRVPALGVEESFIKGLMQLVLQKETKGNFVSSVMCPNKYVKCPCLVTQK